MEHAVGGHVHRDVGALDGDADIIEVAVVQQADVAQGAVHQGLGGDAAVFLQKLPLQGCLLYTSDLRHPLHTAPRMLRRTVQLFPDCRAAAFPIAGEIQLE